VDAVKRLQATVSIVWSTVSKAAERSSNVRAAKSPRSSASRMSLISRSTAASVEWRADERRVFQETLTRR